MPLNFKGKVFQASSSIFKSNDRRLTVSKVTQANVEAINTLLNDSIEVFITTAVREMLVDTSMSVASFSALAGVLGAAPQKIQGLANLKGTGQKEVQSTIVPNTRPNYTSITGKTINEPRGAATGSKLGTKAYTIKYANASSPIVSFKFEAVVWQHAYRMSGSLENAAKAMEFYIEENTPKYLNPLRILRKFLNV